MYEALTVDEMAIKSVIRAGVVSLVTEKTDKWRKKQ
jgi:hypothetical protein